MLRNILRSKSTDLLLLLNIGRSKSTDLPTVVEQHPSLKVDRSLLVAQHRLLKVDRSPHCCLTSSPCRMTSRSRRLHFSSIVCVVPGKHDCKRDDEAPNNKHLHRICGKFE